MLKTSKLGLFFWTKDKKLNQQEGAKQYCELTPWFGVIVQIRTLF